MKAEEKNKERMEELELKIYRKLGVKKFRALTFKLEKIIHKKDKKQNHNYHILPNNEVFSKNCTIDEMEEFKKKLYYNGSIHVKNLILLLVSSIFILLFNRISNYFLIANLLFGIKDAYCVMLQRYNYIRINQTIRKKKNRIKAKIDAKTNEVIEKSNVEIHNFDKTTVDKMILSNNNEKNAYFDISDKEQLYQLKEFLVSNKHLFETSKIKRKVKE